MKRVLVAVLALVAVPGAAAEKVHPIDALLADLYSGQAEGPLHVQEPELNDWLAHAAPLPTGVSDLTAKLTPETVSLHGVVDAGRYRDQLPPSVSAVASLLGGPLAVDLVARLETADGRGTVSVESLSLGGVPLPPSVVPSIVAAFTRNAERPAGFDVTQPFALPAGIERVRLGSGEAWLDLRPRSSR